MALPFIVGPHQCSLTQGPEGRPQVEVVLRIRLPLAEFFDALLLSLAEQHPLFQQTGHEPRLPDTGEGGAAMAAADFPSAGPGDTMMPPTTEPTAGWPPRQATSSGLPAHQYVTHGHIQYRVKEDGTHEHLPPPRAFAHPKKCPVQ